MCFIQCLNVLSIYEVCLSCNTSREDLYQKAGRSQDTIERGCTAV